jgi:predicted TIM-barrel fold metal-dependent hydrolase
VQPINHKFDHSYVSSVLQKYPSKFVGCCLADPTDGGGGVKELQRLVEDVGFQNLLLLLHEFGLVLKCLGAQRWYHR